MHISVDTGNNVKTATPPKRRSHRHRCREGEAPRSERRLFRRRAHSGRAQYFYEHMLEDKLARHPVRCLSPRPCQADKYFWGLSQKWLQIEWKRWLEHP